MTLQQYGIISTEAQQWS
uniref:Uncharacterized protein n=1 Tax=Anguilla anguilla TaxID=7936 RepID=A0A0E9SJD9_ANGAN